MNVKPISPQMLSVFFHDVSLLISSGAAMEDILSTLELDCPQEELRAVLAELRRSVAAGARLSAAMEGSGRFPSYAVHMTQSAEEAGRLEEVTDSLGLYYDRRERTRQLMERTLAQPLLLLGLLTLILAGFVWVILPVLAGVYQSLGGDASLYISGAYIIGGAAFALTLLVLLSALVLWLCARSGRGGETLERLWERSPFTRGAALLFAQAAFADDMQVRLSSGLLPDRSLEQAAAHIGHERFHTDAARCARRVTAGESMGNVLLQERLLPPVCTHILYAAARGGESERAFARVRNLLFDEAEERAQVLIGRVEPLLTGFFTLAVGLSLLAIMLPLIGVMTAMG